MNNLITKKLDNGLTVFMYKDSNKHTTAFSLITKFGGLNGDFKLNNKDYHIDNGMAHLIEHLILEHSIYGNLITELRKKHMFCNGITSICKTEFFFNCVENLEEGIELLIKGINIPNFTKEDLEATKPAIYEEIRINNDRKFRKLFEMRNKQLFKEIPYINTIGTIENVKSFDYDLVKKTHETFYIPSNQIIVVAGNFDVDSTFKLIEKLYKALPTKKSEISIFQYEEPALVNTKYQSEKFNTGEDIVSIAYKIDIKNLTSEQLLELDFYLSYFGYMNFGVNSSLYQELISQQIIVGNLDSEHLFIDGFVIFVVEGFVKNEDEFIKRITETISSPCLDRQLFDLYQKDSKMQIAIRSESIGQMIGPFIENVINFNYPHFDTVDQINSYSFEHFEKMIKELEFSNYVITKLEKND